MNESSEKYRRCAGIISTESDGETILVRLSDGRFFGLGPIGTLIWSRLAQPGTTPELMEFLNNACDSLPASAAGEIVGFISELRREGLLECATPDAGDSNGQLTVPVGCAKRIYVSPRLDRGTLSRAASGNSTFSDGGLTSSNNPGGLS